MDKKVILIIVIILLIATGTVLFFLLKPKGYQSYFNEEFNKCMEFNQQKYYQTMARKTGDTAYCDKLSEEKIKCLAELKKDTSICEEYTGEEQSSCKAEILKNPDLCNPFDFWCIAYASGEEKHCEYLEDEESKQECLAYLRKDAESYISTQTEQECKDSAYVNAAIQTNDASVCNKIANPETKQSCLDAF